MPRFWLRLFLAARMPAFVRRPLLS